MALGVAMVKAVVLIRVRLVYRTICQSQKGQSDSERFGIVTGARGLRRHAATSKALKIRNQSRGLLLQKKPAFTHRHCHKYRGTSETSAEGRRGTESTGALGRPQRPADIPGLGRRRTVRGSHD
ncbi:hypothetical protein NDU88_001088 [Pleurodeles waltl]|uniref:Secreted protein n=1 Tax=Pleurodeles waltl TaxID=8319 RepID=A0AAV7N9T2_PLEWA|nr:hypothetical protein NDU88_001088 [Pleurodeles waltl]